MKRQIKVTELSHDELVNLFSTAFYGNNAYYVDWSDEADKLKDGQGDCFEDHLANILLNGGEIMITDMNAEDEDEFNNGNNLKTSVETITHNSWAGQEEFNLPTYHITLQDIYNGLSKEEASPYVQELFIDEEGDMITADCLMQIILFSEIIYS